MTDPTRREPRPAASPAGGARRPQAPGVRAATGSVPTAAPRVRSTPRRRAAPSTGGVRIPKARASSRPGPSTRATRTAATRNRIEPVQLRGSWFSAFSLRVLVLVGVVVLAAAVVLPSLRAYFRQQEDLLQLRADAVTAQESVDDLTAEVARWDDPAYVEAQARERLAYVYPGETPYRVIDPETVEGAAEGSPAAETDQAIEESGTWYTRLWGSVEEAGEADVDAGGGKQGPASSAEDAD
ncbi:FtsB family cell division protein [Demequina iriomotensis]|uniref:FtsB family cell division protein n=1 Tax=Demequina iriomotensis TaxID=1536641 RepID=UPI0007839907|nr:septum formation initiator family protein [Demequina iriomotensis]